MQKYSVNQQLIETLLSWVKSGKIAIPEIQRPFVWDAAKVRDLLDSLYQGYPIGYLIIWRSPNIRLKDGSLSNGKKILIDGQQRVTALTAAILGHYIVDKTYKKVKIKIAFNPLTEKFEVQNPAILKDKLWIPDISVIYNDETSIIKLVRTYMNQNPDVSESQIEKSFTILQQIAKKQIGLIELGEDLDIETVTEIFIRINKEGVVLSQADFAMSKIASNEDFNGNVIRKAIDYFCHLAIAPDFYQHIIDNDQEFAKTEYFQAMKWLKDENDDLYDPDYNDLLRVIFTSQFNRGKLADFVSLLSGRNFENRTFEEEIVEESFQKLSNGILEFTNESNYKRFLMIIKSAGFISPKLIRSKNSLNFAYILYLKLREQKLNQVDIEKHVRKWFVFSILTGRYSGSPESKFDEDIRNINKKEFSEYFNELETGELSDAFWSVLLPQKLDTSASNSPYFHIYLASQVKSNDKGFLSSDITVADLINHRGDIHHLFPKDYLQKNGFDRYKYNQIANFVYMQTEINIKVGNKSPEHYFNDIKSNLQKDKISGITDELSFLNNLDSHSIPHEITNMTVENYLEFLEQRRKLMAQKIKHYYISL